jgi:hypothetical protein
MPANEHLAPTNLPRRGFLLLLGKFPVAEFEMRKDVCALRSYL